MIPQRVTVSVTRQEWPSNWSGGSGNLQRARKNKTAGSFGKSYVERQNLTTRMNMRRFTRLTNAFSKKLENLKTALSFRFAWYNFCRIHSSLRVTPAMAPDITNTLWSMEDLIYGNN